MRIFVLAPSPAHNSCAAYHCHRSFLVDRRSGGLHSRRRFAPPSAGAFPRKRRRASVPWWCRLRRRGHRSTRSWPARGGRRVAARSTRADNRPTASTRDGANTLAVALTSVRSLRRADASRASSCSRRRPPTTPAPPTTATGVFGRLGEVVTFNHDDDPPRQAPERFRGNVGVLQTMACRAGEVASASKDPGIGQLGPCVAATSCRSLHTCRQSRESVQHGAAPTRSRLLSRVFARLDGPTIAGAGETPAALP